jgi:hypothetical protein
VVDCDRLLRKVDASGTVSTVRHFQRESIQSMVIGPDGDFYFSATGDLIGGSVIKKMDPSSFRESFYCGGVEYTGVATNRCSQAFFQQLAGKLVFDANGGLHFEQNGQSSFSFWVIE